MNEKILYVDDDPNILTAHQRTLRNRFNLVTSLGGAQGLEELSKGGPFAVVLSDLRMPGMDGIQFLKEVKERAPQTVRMMLTGNADLETAAQAVNEGHIFRFLTKPCPPEVLEKALEAGLQQYRLVVAERQLLDETLNGSIKVLTDVLSLINPYAFGRSSRLRHYVKHIAAELGLPDAWQYEVAAMLSQIGCVVLPSETLQKVCAGQELTGEEAKAFASHPDVGGRLLVNIPRLENIAHMIARQMEPFTWTDGHVEQRSPSREEMRLGVLPKYRDPVSLGSNILRVALDFDRLVSTGTMPDVAIESLRRQPKEYDPDVVQALGTMQVCASEMKLETLPVAKLAVQMVLDQDVRGCNGNLLVTKGQEVTFAVLERLRRWAQGVGVVEPIRVLVPQDACELLVHAVWSGPGQPAGAEPASKPR